MTYGLFNDLARDIELGPDAKLLGGFALAHDRDILGAVAEMAARAPFRHMVTPGGWRMSVAMTNCGAQGWVADRKGYRYNVDDPETGQPWPAMPEIFAELAIRAAGAAGFDNFQPDACLINRYAPGSRLSLHQDLNERDFDAPIVSVSLGLPARFLWGGKTRAERPARVGLTHGDVVVWGGAARMMFHGIDTLKDGSHPLTGSFRYNLTFRRA